MFLDLYLNAQIPFRRPRARRIGQFNIPQRALDIAIFICILSSPLAQLIIGKFGGLLAQFIAAVVLVNEINSPKIYIPLGLLAFILGIVEGGLTLLRM